MDRVTRSFQDALQTAEVYSPAEEQFNRRRRTAGLVVGPLAFVALLVAPLPLPAPSHRLAAVLALVIVLWITEALPMAATALLGPVLAIILGVAGARDAFAPFADPIIFLFMGSFMLAEAMFVHGLDRRIAFTALSSRAIGSSGARILAAYGLVAAGLSMWISNTATAAMLFPIGLAVVAHHARAGGHGAGGPGFGLALMLTTSFAASIGGLATPIGTPPNLIGIGMLQRIEGLEIPFFRWMLLGVPLAAALLVLLFLYLRRTCRLDGRLDPESLGMIREELQKLGPMGPGERNVLFAFLVTVTLWIGPGLVVLLGFGDTGWGRALNDAVPEAVAAMIGALLLFLLPVSWRARRFTLTWSEAVRIDWGIILLFGGGLAMGDLAFSTGLAESLGRGITGALPIGGTFGYTVVFTAVAIAMSEAASNTASATMIVPVAIAVADAAGISPIEPALGATLGASMGFMMPISTPPNAIVYASGYVPITAMMRYGLALDLIGFVVIVATVMTLGRVLF